MTAPDVVRTTSGNSTAGGNDVDRVRTLILTGTALGLGAGLMCTGRFAWWLSYPVRFSVGYVGDPFASGLVAARRGWRLIRRTA